MSKLLKEKKRYANCKETKEEWWVSRLCEGRKGGRKGGKGGSKSKRKLEREQCRGCKRRLETKDDRLKELRMITDKTIKNREEDR